MASGVGAGGGSGGVPVDSLAGGNDGVLVVVRPYTTANGLPFA